MTENLLRSISRKIKSLTPLTVLSSAILISACEGKNSESSIKSISINDSYSIATEQKLVRGNYSGPFSLDPHHAIGMDPNIVRDLHEGLVAEAPGGGIRAAVASHWEMLDSKTYLFHLRPTARWSNGDSLTAHDFVFSWQRLVDPATASPHGSYLTDAKVLNAGKINRGELPTEQLGIQAVDDHTVQITLETPVAYFLQTLVHIATFPVHKETILQHGESWTAAGKHVGNGAFKLDRFLQNERVELVCNDFYWDAKSVRLDRVTFLPITEQRAELNRYLAGELDITARVPPPMISSTRKERPGELFVFPTLQTRTLELNTSSAPLNDVNVRRALALAIDRDVITEKMWKRGDLPAYSLVPPGADGSMIFMPDWAQWSQSQREAEARKLLSEAGYSAEEPLRIRYTYLQSSSKKRMALAIAAMWKKTLPVIVEMKGADLNALLDNVENGDFNLVESGIHATYEEPSGTLNYFLSTAVENPTGFSSPEYDRAMLESVGLEDPSQRLDRYATAERIISEEMPVIPLYHKFEAVLVKPHVRGYEPSAIGHVYSRDLWVEPRQH